MKKWTATEWCLFFLTLTIPLTMILLFLAGIIRGIALPPENVAIFEDFLKVLSGGIIGIVGTTISKRKENTL